VSDLQDPSGPGPGLRVAAGVVAVQALALLVVAGAELAALEGARLGLGVTTAVFFAACGLGRGAAGRGLWRAEAWSRGPVVAAQLLVLGVAWSTRSVPVIAGVLAVSGLGVLFLVLSRAGTEALSE
jgi:hypothetical protein